MCCKLQSFILFYFWVIYTVCLLYPLICWWTLCCFHVLAIVNSTTVNIGGGVSFQISFLCIYAQERDHMATLFIKVFWGTSLLFSNVAAWIYIRTNSVWGFPFLYTLSSICCLYVSWYAEILRQNLSSEKLSFSLKTSSEWTRPTTSRKRILSFT